jgi:hypothetical protein
MVATMRDRTVGIATGTETVDPSHLTALQWARIINYAASRLTMDYLYGLKTLEKTVKAEEEGVERFWRGCDSAQFGIVPGGPLGIVCAKLRGLPSDIQRDWPRNSRDPGEPISWLPATEEIVFLRRSSKNYEFVLVTTTWIPMIDEQRMCLKGLSSEVVIVSLKRLLEERGPLDLASKILWRLYMAQQETTSRFDRRAQSSRQRDFEIGHILTATTLRPPDEER